MKGYGYHFGIITSIQNNVLDTGLSKQDQSINVRAVAPVLLSLRQDHPALQQASGIGHSPEKAEAVKLAKRCIMGAPELERLMGVGRAKWGT